MRTLSSACLAILALGGACQVERVVGETGAATRTELPPSAAKPRLPTLIQPQPAEGLFASDPGIGDIDGDGLDDFLIQGTPFNDTVRSFEAAWVYLFYGRTDFPAQLSTEDADAVFQGESWLTTTPLGDINGDGLADFALRRTDSVEFVFGNPNRWRGSIAAYAAGPVWRHPGLPLPWAQAYSAELHVARAHDWNGDGVDDLLVSAAKAPSQEELALGYTFGLMSSHFVPGARGQWKSATWDAALGAAEFGYEVQPLVPGEAQPVAQYLTPRGYGDLDGDGYADLIAQYMPNDPMLVYYGGRALEGTIEASHADARLDLPTEYSLIAVGDVDGDGSNDLLLSHVDALAIAYGRRWSGAVTLEPELIIELEPSSLYAWLAATADDIDGDRSPDIALAVVKYEPESSTAPDVPQNRLYVVRGIAERLVGRIRLDDSYLAPSDAMPVPNSSEDWSITSAGDVDGDGGHDILSATPTTVGDPGAVTLIPSTPRRPD